MKEREKFHDIAENEERQSTIAQPTYISSINNYASGCEIIILFKPKGKNNNNYNEIIVRGI